jgi:hypothetical protein
MDMKSTIRIAATALVSAGIATAAFGGQRGSSVVSIIDARNTAMGSVSGARNSTDNVQLMQCSYGAWASGAISMVCVARDVYGVTRSCLTQNPVFIDFAKSMQGDSILEFRWDADGKCTYIGIAQSSHIDPKALAPLEKRAAN